MVVPKRRPVKRPARKYPLDGAVERWLERGFVVVKRHDDGFVELKKLSENGMTHTMTVVDPRHPRWNP